MSYILEALKKAQAERQLGNAPTIHAPTLHVAPQAAGGRKPLVIGFAAGAVLVAGALFAWRQPAAPEKSGDASHAAQQAASVSSTSTERSAAPMPVAPGVPAAPSLSVASNVPTTPQAPAAKPQSVESAAQVALVQDPASGVQSHEPRQPRVQPVPQKAAPKVAEAAPPAPNAAAKPAAREVAPPAPAAARTVAAQPAPAPSAEENLRTFNELPESLRFNVPKVTFGGYMYSPSPTESLVLIDRVLRHEGEEVAPGLVLEKVLPKAAVMNYRGTRYRVPL